MKTNKHKQKTISFTRRSFTSTPTGDNFSISIINHKFLNESEASMKITILYKDKLHALVIILLETARQPVDSQVKLSHKNLLKIS